MFRPPGQSEFTDVAAITQIPATGALFVQVAGRDIMLARRGDEIVAHSGMCTHQLARLSEGRIEGETVICALHGARFDIATGRSHRAGCPNLPRAEVQLRGRRVLVKPPA